MGAMTRNNFEDLDESDHVRDEHDDHCSASGSGE